MSNYSKAIAAYERQRERMRGRFNPMKDPEIAARVAEATRQRWAEGLQTGSLKGLEAGRVWTDERRAAWKEKAKTSWTPEKRKAAAERMAARHAARKAQAKVLENAHHADTDSTK